MSVVYLHALCIFFNRPVTKPLKAFDIEDTVDRYIFVVEVTAKLFVSTAKDAKSYRLNLSCHSNLVISVQ
jgi:hypothetical protein